MKRYGKSASFGAAVPLALALALAAGTEAQAQERLPSVSDYRLPSPAAAPRPRAQGPVDGDAPVVIAPPDARPAQESGAPAAGASGQSPRPKPSQAARAPAARAPPPSRNFSPDQREPGADCTACRPQTCSSSPRPCGASDCNHCPGDRQCNTRGNCSARTFCDGSADRMARPFRCAAECKQLHRKLALAGWTGFHAWRNCDVAGPARLAAETSCCRSHGRMGRTR